MLAGLGGRGRWVVGRNCRGVLKLGFWEGERVTTCRQGQHFATILGHFMMPDRSS